MQRLNLAWTLVSLPYEVEELKWLLLTIMLHFGNVFSNSFLRWLVLELPPYNAILINYSSSFFICSVLLIRWVH